MPWRCPACQTHIRRTALDGEERPRRGQHYRCHVCRLELELNERTNSLDVVPLDSTDATPAVRSIPLPLPPANPRKRKRPSKRG